MYLKGAAAKATDSVEDAMAVLTNTLARGTLAAFGLDNGRGDPKAMPRTAWIDAKIYDDPIMVGPRDLFRIGATKWTEVRLASADVLAI